MIDVTLYIIIVMSQTVVFLQGVSLEEMEQLFDKPWLKRINLFYYLR